jgi:hypothetical protein
VRDHERGAALAQFGERFLHLPLGFLCRARQYSQ